MNNAYRPEGYHTDKSAARDDTFAFLERFSPASEEAAPARNPVAVSHLVNVLTICGVIFVTFILMLVLPHPDISSIEQRTLAKFPSFSVSALFSGEFTDGLSHYFCDTVPFKDSLKNLSSSLQGLMGIVRDDTPIIHGPVTIPSEEPEEEEPEPAVTTAPKVPIYINTPTAPAVTTEPEAAESTEESQTTTAPPATKPPPETTPQKAVEDGIVSNGIMIYNKMGLMLYGGSFKVGQNYAGYVNAYKKELGDSVNVYSMVIPTSVAYYLPDKYKNLTASQKDNIDNIAKHLDGVVNIDAYGALEKHKNENIYTRTDHHWAGLGAYYAAQEFAKTAGVEFKDLSNYNKVTIPGYVGTLYTYTGEAVLKNNPEDFIYFEPLTSPMVTYYSQSFQYKFIGSLFSKGLSGTSLYCTYLGGDNTIVHIENGLGNGRKLMIIKDSYGNALPSFLTNSFDEIFVCDQRYFELNAIDFIKQHGVTDVLFASCAFSATGSNAKYIEQIRTQGR